MFKSYKSQDKYNISGRGLVFVVDIPNDSDLPKIEDRVYIDNKEYMVRGIEMAGTSMGRKDVVGLLVTPRARNENP